MAEFIVARKKITIGVVVISLILLFVGVRWLGRGSSGDINTNVETVTVGKQLSFPAINSQGMVGGERLTFKIADIEKTDQVIVKDQTFVAKNNKMFLIVNLSIRNDLPIPLNIVPGDLIRLTYNNNANDQYAPDLHNNLVLVAPMSTKLDRVGFVVPKTTKDFTILVGELTGSKERITVHFPS